MNKKILIIELHHKLGGGQIHSLNMYKTMIKNGCDVQMLVPHNTEITRQLENQEFAHIKTKILKFELIKPVYKLILAAKLISLYKKLKFDVIHCNKDMELWAAKQVAKRYPVKIVFTRHVSKPFKIKQIKNINGLICVNPNVLKTAQSLNLQHTLQIKNFAFIPPFFEESKFIDYKSNKTRVEFFKDSFGLSIQEIPILCLIGNLSKRKNQEVLIQAMHELIHKRNRKVQTVFAGTGSQEHKLKILAKSLGVADYCYFLGFTNKTNELIFHSDIKVVPSRVEPFGIVFLEAALLRKPIIGTIGTGAELTIKHEYSGLLFDASDVKALADAIEKILSNPDFGKMLGENAFVHVIQNYSNQVKFEKLLDFYKNV
ncbi:MAG: hypothetical protein US49_C0001G0260 [candidate division TM6 bacterium GW2011_GWF2_37_49]|nr:MAG: hypothetical protein US49_C0001G0260 [candidate division TM6 bacterium GW2011_GWF2_37_49]